MLICGDLLKWILCLITYFYSKVLFHLHIVSHAEVTIFLFQYQKRNEGKEKRKKKKKKGEHFDMRFFLFLKGKMAEAWNGFVKYKPIIKNLPHSI